MTTLTLIETGVYDRLGVPTTDARFTTAILDQFINDALAEVGTEHDWPWLQKSETLTTTGGTSFVTPGETTTAWTGTRYVTITVGSTKPPLERRTMDELLEQYQEQSSGQPQVYAIDEERIELRPIPNGVYTLTHGYVRAEKVLASPSDTPLLPSAYTPALVALATFIALGRSKEDQRAIAAQAHYDRWMSKMLDNRRRDRRPGRIRVARDGWL